MNGKPNEFNLTVPEGDLKYYTESFKALRGEFGPQSGLVLFLNEDNSWTIRIFNIVSRDWLMYCALVYSEIPTGSYTSYTEDELDEMNEAEEAEAEKISETYENAPIPEEEVEEEPEDDETGEDEEETSPAPGERRQIRKPIVVRRTSDRAVTVESD